MSPAAALFAQGLPNPLPPQPLVDALEEFARHTPMQLVYSADIARGVMSPGARAGQSAEESHRDLPRDTGLTFEFVNVRTVTVRPVAKREAKNSSSSHNAQATARNANGSYGVRLARLEAA